MKFTISRTEQYSSDEMPCEGCLKEPSVRVDEKTVDNHEKLHDERMRKDWLARGENHRVINGRIRRDFVVEDWFIEINSMDDLLVFSRKHGEIIVSDDGEKYPSIEIYDGYRE